MNKQDKLIAWLRQQPDVNTVSSDGKRVYITQSFAGNPVDVRTTKLYTRFRLAHNAEKRNGMYKPENMKLFWDWVNERHRVYQLKEAGAIWPWTQDKILQEYKFTNVFRRLDRGTVWLEKQFIDQYPHDKILLFNIIVYRMFNWYKTSEAMGYITNWPANREAQRAGLKGLKAAGVRIFTNAHMLRSTSGQEKIDSHFALFDQVWDTLDGLYGVMIAGNSLEGTFNYISNYRTVGPFLAYEIVTDLTYIPEFLGNAPDIDTWANAGPGAMRGIRRIFSLTAMGKPGWLPLMLHLHEIQDDYKETHVPYMQLRDIEHSLCEFDKYARVLYGEGKPRMKYNHKENK